MTGGGSLPGGGAAASAVREHREIGVSIRRRGKRCRDSLQPRQSVTHQCCRQGHHRLSAPRDHLVAKCATATNIKSTRRDETAEFRAPSDVPTSKCNRKRRKRKMGVPIGDRTTMAVTISQHVSPVRPAPSTNSRWMLTSSAANNIGSRINGEGEASRERCRGGTLSIYDGAFKHAAAINMSFTAHIYGGMYSGL